MDANTNKKGLLRLLASGFYSEVTMHKDKRNAYAIKLLRDVTISSNSSNYPMSGEHVSGNEVDVASRVPAILCLREARRQDDRMSGLFCSFGEKTSLDSSNLLVDKWLHLRQGSGEPNDLRLRNELRLHWNEFIQFLIKEQLSQTELTH
jgi:hypothetical protein